MVSRPVAALNSNGVGGCAGGGGGSGGERAAPIAALLLPAIFAVGHDMLKRLRVGPISAEDKQLRSPDDTDHT